VNSLSTVEQLNTIPHFIDSIPDKKWSRSMRQIEVLQVNVGRLCNLKCRHCHLSCGPDRKEIMGREVMENCISAVNKREIKILDITGGAPELNPNFRWFLLESCNTGARVIVRSNMVILDEPGFEDIPKLYADNGVELICSLPYYSSNDNDRQRGSGIFDRSVSILRDLNKLGYGKGDGLKLNLVYNPGGAFLPPSQAALENDYRWRLKQRHGIVFDNLYTITNNPTGRFYEFLRNSGNLDGYMKRLFNSFNPATVERMMCRSQISVGWDGMLYDCDFNQALGWEVIGINTIGEWANAPSEDRPIRLGNHCYACTAGSGSSCSGSNG